ncbi:MAG: phosphoglucosamine mutase [Oscillospiraceae bacterium]|nr:phosphoglucosamine mutase [Oscillospiraceae bacterium]
MGRYFGTDGFRGEANVTLTAEKAFAVGRFIGWYYGELHPGKPARIAIGKDTRRSSYMLEYSLSAGLTASGADVYLLHVTTTPSVSYVVRTDGFDCGIMISASHNPFYDNGIKIIRANGQKIEPEIEAKIEDYIDGKTDPLPLAHREKIGRTIDYSAGRNRYIGYLLTIPSRAFENKKVGLDCANGASSAIAKSVFEALGAQVFVINNKPDGLNINRECGSTYLSDISGFVKENKLDVGFAYDGDADRCLCVDENGREINGDHIIYICGKYFKENGKLRKNKVVTTVMSNIGLYKALDREGIGYVQTPVGDKYVAEEMINEGYDLGGEQSGHIIFGKFAATGDGILTSLMVMETMIELKAPLSALGDEVQMYPQVLKNVVVDDKKAVMENDKVREAIARASAELGDEGRVLVRESGTEPKIRVMAEARTTELCESIVDRIVEVMKSEIKA